MIPSTLTQWIKADTDLEPRRLWTLWYKICGKGQGNAFRLALEAEGLISYLDTASALAGDRARKRVHSAHSAEGGPGNTAVYRIGNNTKYRETLGYPPEAKAFMRSLVELADESAYNYLHSTQKPAEGGLMVAVTPQRLR